MPAAKSRPILRQVSRQVGTTPVGTQHERSNRQAVYGSDLVADLLKAFDIEYIAFNPGASFRWIHDSIANYAGDISPHIITCCHEETAVSIAHGYAKASGKPMAAALHNVVGLQHATMAIFNAWCDRVPIILLGGTGFMDLVKRRPIEWHHSALVQGTLIRDFVKWDDQPFSVNSVPESFIRAYRLATAEPQGPVYICYDADVQAARVDDSFVMPDLSRYAPSTLPQADQKSLEQAAEWLIEAERPVVIADYAGRQPSACKALLELAELLALPVVDKFNRYNFPTNHPLDITGGHEQAIKQADLILGLDVKDLFESIHRRDPVSGISSPITSPKVKIVHISLWDQWISTWAPDAQRPVPVDLNILADTTSALPQLVAICKQMVSKNKNVKARVAKRFAAVEKAHNALRKRWLAGAEGAKSERPISLSTLALETWKVIKDDKWVLVNGDMNGWARKLWDFKSPRQFLGYSAGGGLGYGMGASIGAALALKDTGTLCINVQRDGDLLYSDSSLWTAAHHRIPLLTIMFNNRTYFNSENHALNTAHERDRDPERRGIGTHLRNPEVDFARLAQSFGIYSEGPIESPKDLAPALRKAIKVVQEKRLPALIDVVCQDQ